MMNINTNNNKQFCLLAESIQKRKCLHLIHDLQMFFFIRKIKIINYYTFSVQAKNVQDLEDVSWRTVDSLKQENTKLLIIQVAVL